MSDLLSQWEAECKEQLAYNSWVESSPLDPWEAAKNILTLIAAYREQQEILKQKDDMLQWIGFHILVSPEENGVPSVWSLSLDRNDMIRKAKEALALQPNDLTRLKALSLIEAARQDHLSEITGLVKDDGKKKD